MRTAVLSLMLAGMMASAASARIWTDITGKGKVDAEYVGMEQGKVKLQINPSGAIKLIPLGALCPEDQELVKQMVAREQAEQDAANGPPDPFTEAIKASPTKPELYVNRGMARTNRKDLDGAIKDFSKAIELDSKNALAYNGRGLALMKKNDLVSAQKDFNEAIRLDPKLASAYRNRGENLRRVALDKKQHVPELDEQIEKWQQYWNHARKDNLSNTPWQPLNATKGDVSRQAAMQAMAKIDIEFADRLERDWGGRGGWGGHGGHGGHGRACTCPACSGQPACPHCAGMGCPACTGGKPAPGLGVYPPQCMKGEKITLVANASQLAKGMPAEAKPGQKGKAAAVPLPLTSVDFYRDADGDGLFKADVDQYLGSDQEGKDGYSLEVSTDNFPPGPQSFFAVGRGAPGSGKGASPEQLVAAADELEKAAEQEKGVAQRCEGGKEQGLPAEQCQGLTGDQGKVADAAQQVAEKIGKAAPDVADMLKKATMPIKAVKNRLATAEKRPGEPNKSDCENAGKKAKEAAEKLTQAASKLRQAAEAAKACSQPAEGQAPADAAVGAPASGANEILAAAPIGARGVGGGGDGGHGDHGHDDHGDRHDEEWTEEVVDEEVVADQAEEYVETGDYDRAVVEYDRLLKTDPENVTYLRDRAATQLLRGGYDYAIRDYDRLLKVHETDADLYYNRGCAKLGAGQLQEALSDFTKSISLNETYSLAYNNRGATYARMAQYDKALADFSKAIEIDPTNKLAYRNRALAYKKLGELRKAEADMEVMVKLEKEKKDNGAE